jgi:hypothetical protein
MTRRSLVGGLGISIFDIMALGLHHIESNRERSLYVRARLLQESGETYLNARNGEKHVYAIQNASNVKMGRA